MQLNHRNIEINRKQFVCLVTKANRQASQFLSFVVLCCIEHNNSDLMLEMHEYEVHTNGFVRHTTKKLVISIVRPQIHTFFDWSSQYFAPQCCMKICMQYLPQCISTAETSNWYAQNYNGAIDCNLLNSYHFSIYCCLWMHFWKCLSCWLNIQVLTCSSNCAAYAVIIW